MSEPFEYKISGPTAELFNKRLFVYLKELVEFHDQTLKTPLKHEFNAYYVGGTLCLDVPFWKPYPSKASDNGKMEVILLNLDGCASSTIYGGFVMDLINLELVREIYVYSKGKTDYYKSKVGEVS